MTYDLSAAVTSMDCVERLLAAVTAGDVDSAAQLFAADARVIRVHYVAGRVSGGESVAVGRAQIAQWLAGMVARGTEVRVADAHPEGDSLVVRTAWSMRGFDGERVQSSSLVVLDVVDGQVKLLRATSSDEEGGTRPAARA